MCCSDLQPFCSLTLFSSLASPVLFSIPPPLSCFQACEIPDTVIFSLAPSEESSLSKPCSVPYWDLIQSSVHGKVELPLPLKHMLFSLFPRPESAVSAWSLPAPIRPDFPRQSLSVPEEQDSGGGLRSRWVKQSCDSPFRAGYQTPAGRGHKVRRCFLWSQFVNFCGLGKRRNALNISTVNLSFLCLLV